MSVVLPALGGADSRVSRPRTVYGCQSHGGGAISSGSWESSRSDRAPPPFQILGLRSGGALASSGRATGATRGDGAVAKVLIAHLPSARPSADVGEYARCCMQLARPWQRHR